VARIFLAEWTGLSLQSEHPLVPMLTQAPMGRGSRPAGNVATVGLRRWRRMCRRNQRDRLMSHSNILTNVGSTCSGILKAQRSRRFSLSPSSQIGLALLSERIDWARVYRVTAPNASKQPARAVA
jgi:hypothetical protein